MAAVGEISRPWPASIDPKNWPVYGKNRLSTGTAAVLSIQKSVKLAMSSNDASHDWAHIARVHAAALTIAGKEGLCGDVELVEMIELAALLHDVNDWKYEEAGVWDRFSSQNTPQLASAVTRICAQESHQKRPYSIFKTKSIVR
jgi:hypothetical protein